MTAVKYQNNLYLKWTFFWLRIFRRWPTVTLILIIWSFWFKISAIFENNGQGSEFLAPGSDLAIPTLDIFWPWKSLKMSFSLLDGFKSRSECHSAIRGDGMWCLFLIFASVFGAIKAFKLGNRILQFMDIKNFYHEALGISSGTFSWYLIGWYV